MAKKEKSDVMMYIGVFVVLLFFLLLLFMNEIAVFLSGMFG